ncbi:MAG: hypothetical protein JST54_20795 [Deltaproteobacteria bacterium]|nr:hypothetical protein [Deltaproteobacteria bacterium]
MYKLRVPILLAGIVLGVAFFSPACTPSDNSPDAGGTIIGTIDTHGGTATNDQGVIIFVPSGALAPGDSVTFTIDPDPSAPVPSGTTPVGTTWRIGPADKVFRKPITIALPVDANKLGTQNTADVAIYEGQPPTTNFGPIVTSPYADGTRVSCSTTTLGDFVPVFGPFADAGGLGASSGSSGSSGSSTTTATSTTTGTSTTTTTTTSTSATTNTSTTGTGTSTSGSGSGSTTTSTTAGSSSSTTASSSSSSTTATSSSSSSAASTTAAASSSSGSGSTTSGTTAAASSDSGSTGGTTTAGSGSTN